MRFSGHTVQYLLDWASAHESDEIANHVVTALEELARLRVALNSREGIVDAPLIAEGEAPRPLHERSADCAANAGVMPPPCGGIRIPQELPHNDFGKVADAAAVESAKKFAANPKWSVTTFVQQHDEETEALRSLAGLTPEARARAINYLKSRYGNLS